MDYWFIRADFHAGGFPENTAFAFSGCYAVGHHFEMMACRLRAKNSQRYLRAIKLQTAQGIADIAVIEITYRFNAFTHSFAHMVASTPERATLKLLKGRPCHVNLIRLNAVEERSLKPVTDKEAYAFLSVLEKGGLSATVRRSMGSDIAGACGQLRAGYLKGS